MKELKNIIGHIALVGHRELFFSFLFFFLDTMSNSSYTLLTNTTDKIDVSIPVKEPTMNNSNDTLKKKYIQIACAVILYWYIIVRFLFFLDIKILILFRFVSITMVFLNKYLLSSNDVKVSLFSRNEILLFKNVFF